MCGDTVSEEDVEGESSLKMYVQLLITCSNNAVSNLIQVSQYHVNNVITLRRILVKPDWLVSRRPEWCCVRLVVNCHVVFHFYFKIAILFVIPLFTQSICYLITSFCCNFTSVTFFLLINCIHILVLISGLNFCSSQRAVSFMTF